MREVGQEFFCFYQISTKAIGLDRAVEVITALASLPRFVCLDDGMPVIVLPLVYLRQYIGAALFYARYASLVPACSQPDNQIVLAILQEVGNIIGHTEAALGKLHHSGCQDIVRDLLSVQVNLVIAQGVDV